MDVSDLGLDSKLTRVEVMDRKKEVGMRLGELEQLYEYKKQLKRLGIEENDPVRIHNYVRDPYIY